jgi:hypothetical protein
MNLFALFLVEFCISELFSQNFEIFIPKGTSHTYFDSEWENGSFDKRKLS